MEKMYIIMLSSGEYDQYYKETKKVYKYKPTRLVEIFNTMNKEFHEKRNAILSLPKEKATNDYSDHIKERLNRLKKNYAEYNTHPSDVYIIEEFEVE